MGTGISDLYFTSLLQAKGLDQTGEADALKAEKAVEDAAARTGSGADSGGSLFAYRLTDSLARTLTRKLGAFSQALSGFDWPQTASTWSQTRLVVPDAKLEGAVSGTAAAPGEATPFYKYFSDGTLKNALTSIDDGEYSFLLTQGGDAQKLSLTVESGQTTLEVLQGVRDAVNGSELSVRADILYQNSPFQLDPSLATTGYVLGLSVNPAREDQTVTLSDLSGHLMSDLGMERTPQTVSPAQTRAYMVGVSQLASVPTNTSSAFDPDAPTTLSIGRHDFSVSIGQGEQVTSYVSKVFDPEAATTLSPGDYDFTVEFDGQSKELGISVGTGWTWTDVMNAVAGQINAKASYASTGDLMASGGFSTPGLEADLTKTDLASETQAGVFSDGRILTIKTTSPFEGASLTLKDGDQGLLAALGLTTKLTGTPLSVTVEKDMTWGDVMNALSSVVGMTSQRLSGETVSESLRSYAVEGKTLFHEAKAAVVSLLDQRLSEPMTLHDGATGLLSATGLDKASPGQDGKMSVDFATMESENDAYSLQQGRVTLAAEAATGGSLPLRVTETLGQIEKSLGSVIAAYDDVSKFLYVNKTYFTKTLTESLVKPVNENWAGLSSIGFNRSSRDGMLWIDGGRFLHSLATDPRTAGAALAGGPQSLIPSWESIVSDLGRQDPRSFLTPETLLLDNRPASMSEFDLEKKYRLLNLMG